MKSILTFIFFILIFGSIFASSEIEFVKSHIQEFYNLDKTALEFEKHLLNIEQKDTALKYIDNYSLALERALLVYNKHKDRQKLGIIWRYRQLS